MKLYYNIGHCIMIVSQVINLNLFGNYQRGKEIKEV